MSIHIKDDVEFTVIAPAGFCILAALKATATELGVALTITSACDGEHSSPQDPHKLGMAYDVRSHDLLPEQRRRVLAVVMGRLGWDRFYGFVEDAGDSNEHLHFQRAKGATFTIEDFLTM